MEKKMFSEKIASLCRLIENELLPLIDGDYVLWDVPYHGNIGDILIWQGEIGFLNKVKYKCLNMASKDTCMFPALSGKTIILLHGGGNFGDLWRGQQEFRLKVIEHYPQNKIIVLPQTVYYQNTDLMYADSSAMASHRNLFLCARDERSFHILKQNFRNPVMLLPDMAFGITTEYIGKWRCKRKKEKNLIVKREDKEAVGIPVLLGDRAGDADIRDWPSFQDKGFLIVCFWKMCCLQIRLKNSRIFSFLSDILAWWVDKTMFYCIRPRLIKQGVRFISGYHHIFTTRLHVMILSVLLSKPVTFLDNSYGKNTAFYLTWLEDLDEVEPFEKI